MLEINFRVKAREATLVDFRISLYFSENKESTVNETVNVVKMKS